MIEPDLALVARQQRQILAELSGMRDDITVLMAVSMRQEAALAALLAETRADRLVLANRQACASPA